MAAEFASVMAGAASAHQAATSTREDTSQQRAGRTRRTSADPQRAQQGATAAPAAAPAALDSLSRLQQLADASPRVAQLRRLQELADSRFAPVAQLAGGPEEEELIQGKFATAQLQPQLQQAPRANNTGLPDQLKSGIESLSGLSMDHVRVHYNSAQPAQLNALAYAQGSDIHLASGQERHLPHEAWHVVQQAQGRVKPTLQMAGGLAVNDDAGLEREADVMGVRALAPVAQLAGWPDEEEPLRGKSAPVQRWQSGHAPVADGSGAGREAGVRVHDPSSQPAAASALTYARGVGIQIAPGEVTPAAPGVAQRTIEGCSKIDDFSKYRSVENLYNDLTRDTKGDKVTKLKENFNKLLTAQTDYTLAQACQMLDGSTPATATAPAGAPLPASASAPGSLPTPAVSDNKTTAEELTAGQSALKDEKKAGAMPKVLKNRLGDDIYKNVAKSLNQERSGITLWFRHMQEYHKSIMKRYGLESKQFEKLKGKIGLMVSKPSKDSNGINELKGELFSTIKYVIDNERQWAIILPQLQQDPPTEDKIDDLITWVDTMDPKLCTAKRAKILYPLDYHLINNLIERIEKHVGDVKIIQPAAKIDTDFANEIPDDCDTVQINKMKRDKTQGRTTMNGNKNDIIYHIEGAQPQQGKPFWKLIDNKIHVLGLYKHAGTGNITYKLSAGTGPSNITLG
jgi:hypothetical protein